jgi:hypothetical protein
VEIVDLDNVKVTGLTHTSQMMAKTNSLFAKLFLDMLLSWFGFLGRTRKVWNLSTLVKVEYVDYGSTAEIGLRLCRFLLNKFSTARLPAMAMEAKLDGIR